MRIRMLRLWHEHRRLVLWLHDVAHIIIFIMITATISVILLILLLHLGLNRTAQIEIQQTHAVVDVTI